MFFGSWPANAVLLGNHYPFPRMLEAKGLLRTLARDYEHLRTAKIHRGTHSFAIFFKQMKVAPLASLEPTSAFLSFNVEYENARG